VSTRHRLIPPPRSDARFTLGTPTTPDPVQVDGEDAHALLAEGELELLGRIPWASNTTLLVAARHDGSCGLAVYKPERGERPLWDFPSGLYRREIAAYLVSEALGWDLVPPTVGRDGPYGPGSVQLFVEFQGETTAFELLEADHPAMRQVAAFDAVINNADRKGGHTLLAPDDHVWAIDHGVCFHHERKLRTVIWEFADEPIPGELLADLDRLRGELRGEDPGGDELLAALAELLTPQEYAALVSRTEELVGGGVFPGPGDSHHPYPWPPV
jgi:uncharacterized repeat protein (TIGR03843 family)